MTTTPTATTPVEPVLLRTRLSVMMFLYYFSVGAWLVTLSTYLMSAPVKGGLNFSTGQVGWIYSSFAIAGMTAPLVLGLLADRLFRADRVFSVAALVMAGLLTLAGWWCESHFPLADAAYRTALESEAMADRANQSPIVRRTATAAFVPLMAIMIGVCFVSQICMILSTVIALRNLPDPSRGFSRTRVWGTIGWVVAGILLGMALTEVSSDGLYLGAASAAVAGVYGFTLPATPPGGAGRTLAEALGLRALGLLRDRSFAVFVGVAFLTTLLNQFYVVYAHRYLTDLGIANPVQVMTLGQVVEIGIMFLIPLLDPRRWTKALMAVGLAGYVVRAIAMRSGSETAVVAFGVTMHGWSYAFFAVVAATYIDRQAPWHLRASAQAIVAFATAGVGPWLGNMLAAEVVGVYRTGTMIDWPPVWDVPLVGCTAALGVFLIFFRTPVK